MRPTRAGTLAGLGAGLLALPAAGSGSGEPRPRPQPNLVIVLADDMGYSDLGCYGGEIETPNLDALAAGGLRYTQFYATPRCCPTRASLLTGLYPHQAGVGHMNADLGHASYRGVLDPLAPTLAEVLREGGYRTFLAGKWHVGMASDRGPLDRGFERFFGLLNGASNHFHPKPDKRLCDGRVAIEPPPDFYSTDAFTDAALGFLREAERTEATPFFLYLAYTAPHWPLHAPREVVAKYRGRYRQGWDAVRAARLERMRAAGLVHEDWDLSPRDARAWEDLSDEQRDELDLRMAIYAAQVDRMDHNIGRLVAELEALGELEHTLILFLADNGACAEGGELGGGPAEQLETREGYVLSYGRAWANASNTPFRSYKHWVHEGGIASPLIAHWPAGIEPREDNLVADPCHLPDLMASCVELAGIAAPPPGEGLSLAATFDGQALPERPLFFEHEGNQAVRRGRWKLVARHGGPWELYDLEADRTETRDLATRRPELARELGELWDAWAERVGVQPWPVRRPPGHVPEPREVTPSWTERAQRVDRSLRVFLLVGQSNMQGKGKLAHLEQLALAPQTSHRYGHWIDPEAEPSDRWRRREDVWIWTPQGHGPLTVGYGAPSDRFGPELQIGHVLGEAFEDPVLLIKLAWGGSSLAVDFRPPSAGGETGERYIDVVELTRLALEGLEVDLPRLAGYRTELSGLIWFQGWNDRINQGFNDAYADNLAHLIRDLRRDLGVPGLPVVIGETGQGGFAETHPRALSLMQAQADVARDEEFRDTVRLVPTRPYYASEPKHDGGYHFYGNAENFFAIGTALGRAALELAD